MVPATSVQLSCSAVPEAMRYRVEVSRFTSFDDRLVRNVVTTPEAGLSGLAQGRYFWRVSSIGERGHEGEFGFARRFTIQTPASSQSQPATAMLAPLDGAVVEHGLDPQPTIFRWRREPRVGAVCLLVLARGATLTQQVVLRRRVQAGAAQVGPLPPWTYRWGVFALDGRDARPLFAEPFQLKVVQRGAPRIRRRPIEWK